MVIVGKKFLALQKIISLCEVELLLYFFFQADAKVEILQNFIELISTNQCLQVKNINIYTDIKTSN